MMTTIIIINCCSTNGDSFSAFIFLLSRSYKHESTYVLDADTFYALKTSVVMSLTLLVNYAHTLNFPATFLESV